MKLNKLAAIISAGISCAYLTQCTSVHQMATFGTKTIDNEPALQDTKPPTNGVYTYPVTRIHQDSTDYFLSGEYGRSADHVRSEGEFGDSSAYPRPDDGVSRYFGEKIVDKFRWLENVDDMNKDYTQETDEDRDRNLIGSLLEDDVKDGLFDNRTRKDLQTVKPKQSSEVNDWVNAQNEVTNQYFDANPIYEQVKNNINALMSYRYSYRKENKDGVGSLELYRHEDGYIRLELTDTDGNKRTLFNERELSEDGNTVLPWPDIYVSDKGSYVAYVTAPGNNDTDTRGRTDLHVIDIKTGKAAIEPIQNADNNSIIWLDDKSFLYIQGSQIKRHEVGSKKWVDPIEVTWGEIDGAGPTDMWYSDDETRRYLVIEAYKKAPTSFIKDTKTNKVYRIHSEKFFNDFFYHAPDYTHAPLASLVHFDDKTLDVYFISGEKNIKGDIFKMNLNNPKKREIVVAIPDEYDETLEAIYHPEAGGHFLIKYLKDGAHKLILTDTTGKIVKDLTPDIPGNADDLTSYVAEDDNKDGDKKAKDKEVADEDDQTPDESYVSFRFNAIIKPRTVYKYSPSKGEFIDVRRRDLIPFDENLYESKQILYTSKDGTKVPMNINYKKGIKLDGKNPTVLYGYGGFGATENLAFHKSKAAWLEHGGVWATAFIRGGSEYGHTWHKDGRLLNKMNVFDDFAAAADYLAQSGYADSNHLAISGASNGGLLVGASMVLHPEKFRVAIPAAGVLDMLRYNDNFHTQYWAGEYGLPYDSVAQYKLLKSYSPYHNVKAGVCYPSTLVMTSKRDDRVTPSHSYKFVAALQDKQVCANPTFLYAAEQFGHWANTYQEQKNDYSLFTSFALNEMNIKHVPDLTHRHDADFYKTDKWREEEAKEHAKQIKKLQQRIDKLNETKDK